MNENQELTFKFNVKITNYILTALANMPYGQVAELIADIQKQASQQTEQSAAGV